MKKNLLFALYVVLIFTVFLPRLIDLDTFLSPDEPQWERNTQNFVAALKEGDFKGLYQQPHPGITTQWLAAPSIEKPTWGEKRLPQAAFLAVAVLYITYLVRRLWGDYGALLAGFLLALNSLLIAHSRVLAMDALLGTFILAAILQHLLWLENKKRSDIALAGIFTALAILSKISGVGLIAYFILANAIGIMSRKISWNNLKTGALVYVVSLLVAMIIVFPTIITDFQYVWQSSIKFLESEGFTHQVHAFGPWWYPQAFLLWTTPIQLIGILLLPIALYAKSKYRLPLILLSIFCILFFLEIQYSIKKGDRYMLPVFLTFDILATGSIFSTYQILKQRYAKSALIGMVIITIFGISFQVRETLRLHPYLLAYRNPLFASVANHRTMGWGEGLDLAADYLNQKPDAEHLLVAAYYENSFAYHFKGEFTSAERLGKETAEEIGAQYVVLYRTMEGRAPERWETKVLNEYSEKTPEHVIRLNDEEYVWIYKVQ